MENSQLIKHSKTWDRTGVIIASVCLIHCLSLPLLIAAMPTVHGVLENPWIEIVILACGILIGSFTFISSFKKHEKWGPMILGLLGVLLLAYNLFFIHLQEDHHHHGVADFDILVIVGSLILIAGHFWNIRECHCFCNDDCSHEKHQEHAH